MSYQDNILIKVHRIALTSNGMLNSSVQLETDLSDQLISSTALPEGNVNIDNHLDRSKLLDDSNFINYRHFVEDKRQNITLIKVGGVDDLNPMNFITQINSTANSPDNPDYIFTETKKEQVKRLNLPDTSTISCQNCDTSFPTKYQYQRHQCEFNAEKVVLKPEIAGKDVDKATRLRFECDVCKKSFVSNNNLERHKNCHKNRNSNVCEFCSKTFVSENRLKIHKENHCKKAGDTTKFYRSDVAVWRCEQCKQVFATHESGNKHIKQCTTIEPSTSTVIKPDVKPLTENNIINIKSIFEENNFDSNFENAMTNQPGFYKETTVCLEKIITEMLYQCEFCNRTYAEKLAVLHHQKTHTTEKNYECIFCDQHFNSYCQATVHWQSKCNNESNLFYLPKMIYCEHCDRGFKSHEILYNHKNKKKHFTPKNHNKVEEKIDGDIKSENEKAIAKLIENMITKLDQNVKLSNESSQKENDENNLLVPVSSIKIENEEDNNPENGKKKRGRKRKWQKTEVKNKIVVEEGCQYQCERCAAVFETIASLDLHKDTAHASTYRCEQCGQESNRLLALMKDAKLVTQYDLI